MADDDEDGPFGSPNPPTGPRRSTYTPPPTGAFPPIPPVPAAEPEAYDDDDLANALAEEVFRITHPGSRPPTPPAEPARSAPTPDEPLPTVPLSAPEAVLPVPPKRRSLPDTDLIRSLGEEADRSSDTGSLIDRLEAELRLRQAEAREMQTWTQSMLAIGSPEALASVDETRADPTTSEGPHRFRSSFAPPEPGELAPARSGEGVPSAAEPLPSAEGQAPTPDTQPPVYDLIEPAVPEPADLGEVVPPLLDSLFQPPTASVVEQPPAPPEPQTAVSEPDFEALIAGASAGVAMPAEPIDYVPAPRVEGLVGAAGPVFREPTGLPLDDVDDFDDVDETDRAPEESVPLADTPDARSALSAVASGSVLPDVLPSEDPAEVAELRRTPVFRVERIGAEPTPIDHRVGRAARLFWLWFAVNSSVLGLAFGGVLFSLGMSLRQTIVAAFVGVALSFLPLGLGTLAGKWSGQPTMIVSRASFGLVGNVVPAVLAVISRLFWGAVLLWLIAASTAHILVGADLSGPLDERQLMLIVTAAGFLIALAVAVLGYGLVARIQLVLSIVSGLLIVGLVAMTWSSIDIGTALTVGDGPWILVVTGVVLVFSFVGLAWASASSDVARYQRPGSSGATSMLWASFGSALPAFLLIGYGALLAASDPTLADGLAGHPLDAMAGLLPSWYPVPLIAATALSLLSGVVLSIYSGGFALRAIGLRLGRSWSTAIVGVLLFAAAMVIGLTVTDVTSVFRDLATTLAVPVAAWAGIFAAEMILRRRRFDAESLLHRGGIYPAVSWVNLSMLVVAAAVGFGFTSATVGWLGWEGYLFTVLGVPLTGQLAGTDLGVIVALVLGLLTPFVSGLPRIRRQESSIG
ncbi:MAG TPA: cytosine permease [Lacisediminihabitans sp.]|uniref:purine-cytosine permease family protein n=1 Tax=Lacisediminihabitans sp. TaxID=2787631 RepID=UPI002ED86C34